MSLPLPRSGPSRRQLAVGGVATTLLGLTGCTDDAPDRLPALPRLTRDPDRDLVVTALAVERSHLQRLSAVRRRHRRLRAPLAASAAVHLAHEELLRRAVEAAPAPDTASGPVPGVPSRALAALAASARSVSRRQVDIAMAAESGTFARLAAGLAAAAAQQERLLAELAARSRSAR